MTEDEAKEIVAYAKMLGIRLDKHFQVSGWQVHIPIYGWTWFVDTAMDQLNHMEQIMRNEAQHDRRRS